MSRSIRCRAISVLLALLALAANPLSSLACTACFGQQTDSPMAQGMNWGIMSLMVVILGVLGFIASFFVFMARRAASHPLAHPEPATAHPSKL